MMIMISPLSTSTVAVSIQSAAAKVLEPKKESSILRSSAGVSTSTAAMLLYFSPPCASAAPPAAIRPVTISTNPFRKTQLHGARRRRSRVFCAHQRRALRFKANEMGPAFFDDGKKPVGLGIYFYNIPRIGFLISPQSPSLGPTTMRPVDRPSVRPSVRPSFPFIFFSLSLSSC